MSHYQHLLDQLKQLRLGGLLDTLEVRLKEAEKRQLAYVDFLTLLIQDELERRSQTKFARRLKKACFAESKTLEEFDFGFNPNIKRRRIYDLATCRFLENKENICLCGPVGVGKSHIALALGHEAVRRGHDVRYIQAPRLFRTLEAARADLSRDRRIQHYCGYDFLIIDDFGLKPLTEEQADDLYDIVYERYQKGSLMLTSNRSLEEWMALFGDPIQATRCWTGSATTLTSWSGRASLTGGENDPPKDPPKRRFRHEPVEDQRRQRLVCRRRRLAGRSGETLRRGLQAIRSHLSGRREKYRALSLSPAGSGQGATQIAPLDWNLSPGARGEAGLPGPA